jgi:hypothetical protein
MIFSDRRERERERERGGLTDILFHWAADADFTDDLPPLTHVGIFLG